jgi:hypothetical protein
MRLRRILKNKQDPKQVEEDFLDNFTVGGVVEFHPHCYTTELALASAKRFDEMYALAHAPAHYEDDEEG